MNVGDKVWYIGRDNDSLYVNTRDIYTVDRIVECFDNFLHFKEIEEEQFYAEFNCRLATAEELITYNNNKAKELCSI